MHRYARTITAIAIPLLFLYGCNDSLSPQGEKDFALAGEACMAMKSSNKQTSCIDSLVRLTGKKIPESALPKPPPPLGKAREEITFKGIPFDQPGQRDHLLSLCPKTIKYNYSTLDNKCPTDMDNNKDHYVDKRPSVMFSVPYGAMDYTHSHFRLNNDGSLQQVSLSGSTGEMLSMIVILSEKYGPPSIETSEVQNGFGAKFEKTVATWIDVRGTQIVIKTRDYKVDSGQLTIESASEVVNQSVNRKRNLEAVKANL